MSISYFVKAHINEIGDNTIILRILERGSNLGFLYLDYVPAKRYEDGPVLTSQETLTTSSKHRSRERIELYIKFEDTYFHLAFYQEEGSLLIITLGTFGYRWEKRFIEYDLHIDLARYSRLLMKLLDNFKIIDMLIEGL